MPRIGEAHNETTLMEALREMRTRRLQLRLGHETQWWKNIVLLSGDHYAQWDPTIGQLIERPKKYHDEVRLALNQARVVARTEFSRLTKSRPMMEVVAASEESDDLSSARVGKKALEAADWKFRLIQKRKQALWWMVSCGLGAMYVGYDWMNDKDGKFSYIIDPTTGEPTFDPRRIKAIEEMLERGEIDEVTKEEYPLGDLEYKVYSPFQLLPDEKVLDFDEIRDLITTDIVDVDWLSQTYGRKAANISPEQVHLGSVERRMMGRAGLGAGFKDPAIDGAAQLHTYWLLPNTFPGNNYLKNGLMVRWVGDQLLEITTEAKKPVFPFDDGRIPFAFYKHIPQEMTIWPASTMQDIYDVNMELNKTVSMLLENRNYMSNPMWRIAAQHQIRGKVKNRAGGIVRYVHAPNIPPPEPIQGFPMPAQIENLAVALRDQILDISGQGETSRGRVPSGVRSGVAVAYLQEEDETRLGPTTENFEWGVAVSSSLTLSRFSQFYHTERIMRLYNRGDGYFDVIRFKGADLKGIADVIPVVGSSLPKSKAVRQQNVLDMVALGVEKDPKRIRDMLELGMGEPDEIDKDFMQATRENQLMLLGVRTGKLQLPKEAQGMDPADPTAADEFKQAVSMAVPVYVWHNHAAHLQRHYSVMKDEEFERLSRDYPDIVRLFNEHTAMHEQELQKQQQAQMEMMLASRGAPGGTSAGEGQSAQDMSGLLEGRPSGMNGEADVRERAQR